MARKGTGNPVDWEPGTPAGLLVWATMANKWGRSRRREVEEKEEGGKGENSKEKQKRVEKRKIHEQRNGGRTEETSGIISEGLLDVPP